MENKLELRDGDVVRLKPATVFATFLDGSFQIEGSDGFFKPDMVESIITRVETPQETIARLKQIIENQASGVQTITKERDAERARAENYRQKYERLLVVKKKKFASFERVDGYGPWIMSEHLPPETNIYGLKAHYENGKLVAYCKKLSDVS